MVCQANKAENAFFKEYYRPDTPDNFMDKYQPYIEKKIEMKKLQSEKKETYAFQTLSREERNQKLDPKINIPLCNDIGLDHQKTLAVSYARNTNSHVS